jgi:hypothetical protein
MRAPITATTTKQQNSASSEGGARSPAALAAASWSKTACACAWGIAAFRYDIFFLIQKNLFWPDY